MKTTKIIILLALLVIGSMGSSSLATAQIDANTPSHERPVIEESTFDPRTKVKEDGSEEMEWLKWIFVIALLGLTTIGGVTVYRVTRSPKKIKKN